MGIRMFCCDAVEYQPAAMKLPKFVDKSL